MIQNEDSNRRIMFYLKNRGEFCHEKKVIARKKMVFFNIITYFFKKVKRAPVFFNTDGKLKFFNFWRKMARICVVSRHEARIGEYGSLLLPSKLAHMGLWWVVPPHHQRFNARKSYKMVTKCYWIVTFREKMFPNCNQIFTWQNCYFVV